MVTAALSALRKIALKKEAVKPLLTGDKLVRELGVSPARLPIEATDVQGLVFRGYGTMPECCYPLLQIRDPARAREWLGALVPQVSPGVPAAEERAVHVAFTHAGLAALGLPDEGLQGFSREFIAGMVAPHRSRFLGDDGPSAPEKWEWGSPTTPTVHVLLILFAKDRPQLDALLEDMKQRWSAGGLTEIRTLRTNAAMLGKEHFGFTDGISQPSIEGYHPAATDLHLVKPGEFLLGYENEYGEYTPRPLLQAALDPFGLLPLDVQGSPRRDLGRNGTYLVFRQLGQDVAAFQRALDAQTRHPDGTPNPEARVRLAAQMVGRWPSGASLIEAPHADDSSKARNNEYRYHHEDRDGLKCPIGSHVRRANPRDALAPRPGTDRSLEINRRHRILRRGRTYGAAVDGAPDGKERGLMFIALNGNIVRQFEFIQHSWIADPRFNGLYGEADPIVGAIDGNEFEGTGDPVRMRCTGLPRFVTVKGGAYFFMPGLRALRYLARLGYSA